MTALGLILAGCNSENDVVVENAGQTLVPVTVRVGGFSFSVDEFHSATTRAAQPAADYAGLKRLTLAFYDGTAETYKVTQTKGSLDEGETFGEFALSLPFGNYTMVVIGHGNNTGEPAVALTSPSEASFGDSPARETFVATQTVNVASNDAVDISATLNRVVSKLQVASTDGHAAGVKSVRMTFAGGSKSFCPLTGLATDNLGFSNAVDISAPVGALSMSNSYLFLTASEQTMDVTIETLADDGNVVFSKVIKDVPFRRNRVTVLRGAIYSNSGIGGAFQVDTAWETDHDITF